MLEVYESSAFKKDRKRESKNPRNKDLDLRISEILFLFSQRLNLPQKYKLHKPQGKYVGFLECHVKPDLLMIFSIDGDSAYLYRLGSHSELFK